MAPSLFGAAFKSPRLGARTRSTSSDGSGAVQINSGGGPDSPMDRQHSGAVRKGGLKLPMPQQPPPGGGELAGTKPSADAASPGTTTPARGLIMDEVCARSQATAEFAIFSIKIACMVAGRGLKTRRGAKGCLQSLHACYRW